MSLFSERHIAQAAEHWQSLCEGKNDGELRGMYEALRRDTLNHAPAHIRMAPTFGLAGECARRYLGKKPFPVQYQAACALVMGKIVQMNTGEGKTLTAIPAACMKAMEGQGVHVITVNEYLAQRDHAWNKPVFDHLGISAGLCLSGLSIAEKQVAYQSDITYVTATEAGFDHLRDGIVYREEDRVQRKLHFAIVDEADSILLDEAVTPMLLSGGSRTEDIRQYSIADVFVRYLKGITFDQMDAEINMDALCADYVAFRRTNTCVLTRAGIDKAERFFRLKTLFDAENLPIYRLILHALTARIMLEKDKDYIIRNGRIQLVDRNTGRIMEGRRYTAGLHQAVEAREQLEIHPESQTLASISYQNFFAMYDGLSGMTGTAWTARKEFSASYALKVQRIAPHKPCIRIQSPDRFFRTQEEKLSALVKEVHAAWKKGRPVLIGTPNDQVCEAVSRLLEKRDIPHQVLSAKQDADEAQLVAQSGMPYMVTVATNMAGRGTDICLGGNEVGTARLVREAGGLLVLGAERQRSRRVDDQLLGRAGRQGDPGEGCFFVSSEDEILRLFGSAKRAKGTMPNNHTIRKAQRMAEKQDATLRKIARAADAVLQKYRKHFLQERELVLTASQPIRTLERMIRQTVCLMMKENIENENDYAAFRTNFHMTFGLKAMPLAENAAPIEDMYTESAIRLLQRSMAEAPDAFPERARKMILLTMDEYWSEFLNTFEELRVACRPKQIGTGISKALIAESQTAMETMGGRFLKESMQRVFKIGEEFYASNVR